MWQIFPSSLHRRNASANRNFLLPSFLSKMSLLACDTMTTRWPKYKALLLRVQIKKFVFISVLNNNIHQNKTKQKTLFWFHSSTTCHSGESLVMLTWKLFGTPWNLNICSRPQHLSTVRASLKLLHRFRLFLSIFLLKKKKSHSNCSFSFFEGEPFRWKPLRTCSQRTLYQVLLLLNRGKAFR